MLRKYFKRSALTSAAVGSVLVVAGAGAPMVATAPMSHGDCGDYAAPTSTSTTLTLSDNVIQFGRTVIASTRTRGEGNPSGPVTFSVNGDPFATVGEANAADGVRVPMLGAGETYTIRARFHPRCDDDFDYQPSSDSAQLTVFKADTTTTARAADRDRGERPVVRGVVDSSTKAEPGGEVRVTIRNGDAVRTQDVPVTKNDDGTSSYRAEFGRVFKRGEWTVVARYLGTRNFQASSARTTFNVTR